MKMFNVQVTVELLVDIEALDEGGAITKAVDDFRTQMKRLGAPKTEIVEINVGNVTEVEDPYPFGQSGAV